ncbi:MAG TPA: hypothetical protein VIT67_15125 [Povalibacter sp.]
MNSARETSFMNRVRIMFRHASLLVLSFAFLAAPLRAEEAAVAPGATADAAATQPAAAGGEFKSLDQEVQSLKKEVLDLNRELFVLEEDLLFPANTQVAVFVSMDVGEFFGLDSVTLKLDNKEVANYLYTEREAQALLKGGVHRVFIGNLKTGDHELIALFTGQGPHVRDYRRGATLKLTKGVGAKYVELKISDRASKAQPEFVVKEWE